MKLIFIITFIMVVSLGCSSARTISLEDRDKEYALYIEAQELTDIEEINSFTYSGANPLSNKYLTIFTNRHDKYLIELVDPCQNLYTAGNVHLDKFSNYTLSSKDAFIVDSLRCNIKSIYPLTKAQHIKIMAIKRKARSAS